MNSQSLLDEKKEKKELFSVHSLMNEYKISEEEAKKVCLLASQDKTITTYYFVICSKCQSKAGDGVFDSTVLGKQRQCFSCKYKFMVSNNDLELVYDPRSMKDKLKLI